jgi:hypothetical protein
MIIHKIHQDTRQFHTPRYGEAPFFRDFDDLPSSKNGDVP